ncbi:amastin-like protein [Leishmania major strain Friedlin]|uniref:Amastin-like protein n=1 Tax=Leishmania major TaxID=5664 RepID=Q4Q3F7_LEIMA|nr:amastin-like protein [Leishmania major strain Friedlin]CAG9581806.1 amastin-like_protein [Leishmania major strain Friedlin]CAJ07755.1 amastin-like protein [Leishmania major strain Friedlin]|eukprot:XP_001686141.1 amastin-like protein [Leishmania major strain Friedlin]
MALRISMIVYVVLQFIAFFFVLVGTPLDMFRGNDPVAAYRSVCITLWGWKSRCTSSVYEAGVDELWRDCGGRRKRFRAAQVLAVISIFVYGAAFVLGVLLLCCCSIFRLLCLALNIVGVFTLSVVWVVMVVTYYKHEALTCPNLKGFFNYGAGFALFLVAWCLDIINIAVLLLPCQNRGLSVSEKLEEEDELQPAPEAEPMQESAQHGEKVQ